MLATKGAAPATASSVNQGRDDVLADGQSLKPSSEHTQDPREILTELNAIQQISAFDYSTLEKSAGEIARAAAFRIRDRAERERAKQQAEEQQRREAAAAEAAKLIEEFGASTVIRILDAADDWYVQRALRETVR